MANRGRGGVDRRTLLKASAAGAGAAALATRGRVVRRAGAQETIKIVSPIPVTGPLAADGQEMQRGLQMAVDEAMAAGMAGGAQIELVVIDTETMTPEIVTTTFARAIEDEDADAIIIGYATGTGPEYDLLADADNPPPYIHFNTFEATAQIVREDPERYYMVFQADPSEIWYGQGIITLMQQLEESGAWTPSSRKAAVITSDNLYSQSIAGAFKEGVTALGWEVVVDEKVPTPVSDWSATLAKIREAQPAMIVNTNFNPADLATFTVGFAEAPSPALLYEQFGPSIPEFLDLAGEAANGVIWSTVIGLLPDEMGNEWKARYTEKFGEAPGLSNAGSCYDAVMLYLKAVEEVGGTDDRRAICEAILNTRHRGVCGAYRFDPADQTAIPYPDVATDPEEGLPHLYFQIQDGEQVLMSPEPFATGEFQTPGWLDG
jgi:branched-chain amino acid transport system substrate-binding protein